MNELKVKIDKFGRLLIPKTVRRDLGMRRGVVVKLTQEDNHLIISLPEMRAPLENKSGVLVFTGEPMSDLQEAIDQERKDRDDKIGGF